MPLLAPLLFPVALLLLDAGGWWTEISRTVYFGSFATAALWLGFDYIGRATGSPAARAFTAAIRFVPAGFFLALGTLCLRNGGPLVGALAWTALALGGAYAMEAVRRF